MPLLVQAAADVVLAGCSLAHVQHGICGIWVCFWLAWLAICLAWMIGVSMAQAPDGSVRDAAQCGCAERELLWLGHLAHGCVP